MFRFSLIVCVSLIFGISAKPYKPWDKHTDEAFQDTVMSINDKGEMSWGVEVEPPEDMDKTAYDIDPAMGIWKIVTGSEPGKQPLNAEEDLDMLSHPSLTDLLKLHLKMTGALPDADIQGVLAANMEHKQEPEEDKDDDDHPVFSQVNLEEPEQDWDEVYHKAMEQLGGYLAPLNAEYKAGDKVRVALSEPEMDEDELYHRDHERLPVQAEPLTHEVVGESEVKVHLQPEADMDDLYHIDVSQLIPYQGDTEAAADVLPQRKHSEPEEDLDDFYHQ
ncbi:uncharacterized protein si:ch211-217g15.3 [Dicentrarchus labrax]|uniref:uncharacterized protein si:ch211-217g15.3 n=1 Tax=Dicentrarchus labrax TaxID=13489 RepID=UPI0021F6746B|nr:uncharacterized protein si:ch211-217g15.3 [Dicentrarchus labrax]